MKLHIGLFFGGESVEHEISVISALQAARSFDRLKYELVPVYITKSGEMYTGAELLNIDAYRNIPALLKISKRVIISRENGTVQLYDAVGGFSKRKPLARIDFAFPVAHGTNTEDGSLQGYFELLGLPYAGCDILSSALGMDKIHFKTLIAAAGLPALPCVVVNSREYVADKAAVVARIEEELGFPIIIKPANLGSSVGISKANTAEEFDEGMSLAISFADRILCESAICNLREINCSVLGDEHECRASVCEEPVSAGQILSYDDKYVSKGSKDAGMASLKRRLPAEIPPEKAAEIQGLAVRVFQALGCSGVSRIDFLLDADEDCRVYVNEINTIPGSLAFYLWEETGVKYSELLEKMVEIGLRRRRSKENLMFTYDTNVLESGTPFGKKTMKN